MTTICSKGQKLKTTSFNVHKLQTDDNLVFSSFFICCFKEYYSSLMLGGMEGVMSGFSYTSYLTD